MKGAIAEIGRQGFVTATWLEWRRRLSPSVPDFGRQARACRVFGQVFDGNRRAGIDDLTETAIAVEWAETSLIDVERAG